MLTEATAELALALTLAAARLMSDAERDLRAGRWRGWDPGAYLGLELRGATVGVVGLGRIGGRYAELVRAIGAEVRLRGALAEARGRALARRPARPSSPELLEAADVVSVHAPASPETHHLIGRRRAGPDRPRRRPRQHLAAARWSTPRRSPRRSLDGRLGAAGLDVYENEPHVPQSLLDAPRCVLLPHIGSATISLARRRWRGWRPRT